jgi:hypothetical protein
MESKANILSLRMLSFLNGNRSLGGILSSSLWTLSGIILILLPMGRFYSIRDIKTNWDTGLFLDGAYRIFSGQVPHRDFSTIVGTLLAYVGSLGYQVYSPGITGYEIGVALFCFFSGIHLAAILVPNMGILALVPMAFILPMIVSSTTLSYGDWHTYTGYYNKLGYFYLFIHLFWCLFVKDFVIQSTKEGKTNALLVGAIGMALAMVLSILTKITVGFLCLALVFSSGLGLYVITISKTKTNRVEFKDKVSYLSKSYLIAFAVLGFAYLIAMYSAISGLFQDLQILFLSAKPQRTLQSIYVDYFEMKYWVIAPSIILTSYFSYRFRDILHLVLSLLYLLVISPMMAFTTGQPPDFQDCTFVIFITAVKYLWIRYSVLKDVRFRDISAFVVIGVCSVIFGPFYSIKDSYFNTFSSLVKLTQNYNAFLSIEEEKQLVSNCSDTFNDIEKYLQGAGNQLKLLIVDSPDCISSIFGLPKARNTPLYWHHGVTFSDSALQLKYFQEENIFSDVDVIILPPSKHPPTNESFEFRYRGYLKDLIKEKVGQTDFYLKPKLS